MTRPDVVMKIMRISKLQTKHGFIICLLLGHLCPEVALVEEGRKKKGPMSFLKHMFRPSRTMGHVKPIWPLAISMRNELVSFTCLVGFVFVFGFKIGTVPKLWVLKFAVEKLRWQCTLHRVNTYWYIMVQQDFPFRK